LDVPPSFSSSPSAPKKNQMEGLTDKLSRLAFGEKDGSCKC